MNNFDLLKQAIKKYIENTPKCSTATVYSVLSDLLDYADGLQENGNDGWISVDNALPNPEQEINFLDREFEPSNFYLIQLKDGYINTAYYATICDDCEYEDIFISCTVSAKDNRYYVEERGFDTYTVYEVSYWQPLPNPVRSTK